MEWRSPLKGAGRLAGAGGARGLRLGLQGRRHAPGWWMSAEVWNGWGPPLLSAGRRIGCKARPSPRSRPRCSFPAAAAVLPTRSLRNQGRPGRTPAVSSRLDDRSGQRDPQQPKPARPLRRRMCRASRYPPSRAVSPSSPALDGLCSRSNRARAFDPPCRGNRASRHPQASSAALSCSPGTPALQPGPPLRCGRRRCRGAEPRSPVAIGRESARRR